MATIIFENVTKKYGDTVAIDNLSFEIKDGEFFGILGPSGAGKTTILNLIAGLQEITSGNIYMNENLINDIEPRFRDVSYAFENYSLYTHLNVYDNISFPLKSPIRKGQYSQNDIEDRVNNISTALQIKDLLDRGITQLSGGQRQRVALARTLVREPLVYILDEAIAHLDAKLRHSIRVTLKGYQAQKGVTTIYATPDQMEAVAMCDRVLIINNGELQQIGMPNEIYSFPMNLFVATLVGIPPMNVLDATIDYHKGEIRINEERLQLDNKMRQVLEGYKKDKVKLGIRPTELVVSKYREKEKGILSGEVMAYENFGDHMVHTIITKEGVIKDKMNKEYGKKGFDIGEMVSVTFGVDKIFLFDENNGKTILHYSEGIFK